MPSSSIQFSVFTKPWHLPLPELAALVKGWGFDGVELPVRPGYQVTPENVRRGLPEAVRILARPRPEGLQRGGPYRRDHHRRLRRGRRAADPHYGRPG